MPVRPLLASAAAIASTVLLGGAAPQSEEAFLDRLVGRWSGSGTVVPSPSMGPQRVRCSLEGRREGQRVTIDGTCRAHLVFTRRVSADVRFDPGSRRYAGTYVGAKVGPAAISGRRRGDTLSLTVRWPRPVYGDRTARMQIELGGSDLRIRVLDDRGEGEQPVTDVGLAKD